MARRLAVPAELEHLIEKRDVNRRSGESRRGASPIAPAAAKERRKSQRREKSRRKSG